jgi:dihydrofolate reductase
MNYNLIVAICKERGIGYKGTIPWHIKEDMRYFSKLTRGINGEKNAIIMGSTTWNSLPNKYLPNRNNLILSYTVKIHKIMSNGYIIKSFDNINDIINFCNIMKYDNNWIIGGASIYKQFLDKNIINKCYITNIDKVYDCDTFFPELNCDSEQWKLYNSFKMKTEDNINLEFNEFHNANYLTKYHKSKYHKKDYQK